MLYQIVDPLLGWYLDTFGHPRRPQWFKRILRAYLSRHFQRYTLPAIMAAQEARIGYRDAWAEPTTPHTDILVWVDEQLANTAGTPLPAPSLDVCVVGVVYATRDEWVASQADDAPPVRLPADRVICEWQGHRSAWWMEGRDVVAAALPETHDGLYIVVNRTSEAMATAFGLPLRT